MSLYIGFLATLMSLLIFTEPYKRSQAYRELDGVIVYTFIAYDYVNYRLSGVRYIEIELDSITFSCDFYCRLNSKHLPNQDEYGVTDSDFSKNRSLNFSHHYRDLAFVSENPVHYGGDIYFDNSETDYPTLKISFNVFGSGMFISESSINEINHETTLSCPNDDINLLYYSNPTLMLIHFDSTSTLSAQQMKVLNIVKDIERKSFLIYWCE